MFNIANAFCSTSTSDLWVINGDILVNNTISLIISIDNKNNKNINFNIKLDKINKYLRSLISARVLKRYHIAGHYNYFNRTAISLYIDFVDGYKHAPKYKQNTLLFSKTIGNF